MNARDYEISSTHFAMRANRIILEAGLPYKRKSTRVNGTTDAYKNERHNEIEQRSKRTRTVVETKATGGELDRNSADPINRCLFRRNAYVARHVGTLSRADYRPRYEEASRTMFLYCS